MAADTADCGPTTPEKVGQDLFFSTLIDSARHLPDLRCLKIKASIEESSWRDRVTFRDKWKNRLRYIFLRQSDPPNPHHSSFTAFTSWKKQQKEDRKRPKLSTIHRPKTRNALKIIENLKDE